MKEYYDKSLFRELAVGEAARNGDLVKFRSGLLTGAMAGYVKSPSDDFFVLRPLPEEPAPRLDTTAAIPSDSAARKALPVTTGVLDYFPLAMLAVAACSKAGNDQHNPGKPLHWDRSKSMDHADCLVRHLLERGKVDKDGIRHSAKLAWRAMALLQLELEAAK